MKRQPDFYSKKARKEGYKSRAAYKLRVIHQKFTILKEGDVIVDLCGTPGGFSQIAKEIVGKRGDVFLFDLDTPQHLPGVKFLKLDITRNDSPMLIRNFISKEPIVLRNRRLVVLSDCSPKVTGHWSTDHARQIWLAFNALRISVNLEASVFLAKAFQGEIFSQLVDIFQKYYEKTILHKPKVSRKESAEIYLLGIKSRNIPWEEPTDDDYFT